MKHLAATELRDMVVNAGLSETMAAVPAILDGYKTLRDKEDRTADEDKILFECALCVAQNHLHGLAPEAMTIQAGLIEARGLEYYRPTPPPQPEPEPEPAPETETETAPESTDEE